MHGGIIKKATVYYGGNHTYFVDTTYGNDSYQGYRRSDSAWKTIGKVNGATFAAGDTILFHAGQTWREQLTVPNGGTAAGSVTFTSYGVGATPIINGADLVSTWTSDGGNVWHATLTTQPSIVAVDGTPGDSVSGAGSLASDKQWYWTSNTLSIYSSSNPNSRTVEAAKRSNCVVISHPFITISGLELKHAISNGVYFTNDAHTSWDTLKSLTIDYCGKWGIHRQQGTTLDSNCYIGYNTIHHTGADGVDIKEQCKNFMIEHNTVYDFGLWWVDGNGIGINSTGTTNGPNKGHIVQYNTCYSGGTAVHAALGWNTSGIHIDDDGDVNGEGDCNIIVRYNVCRNNLRWGLTVEACSGVSIYNNLIYRNGYPSDYSGGGFNLTGDTDTTRTAMRNHIYNNTISENFRGIYVSASGTNTCSDNVFKNNVVSGSLYYALQTAGGAENDGVGGHGNVWLNNSFDAEGTTGSYMVVWGSTNCNTYVDWETAYGGATESIQSYPLYVDSANADFRLQSGSPCINTGINVGLTQDYAGNSIVSLPDVGAYETTTAATTYKITVTQRAHGAISPVDSVIVASGKSAHFVITPTGSYAVQADSVDGAKVDSLGSLTLTNITANHTVSASFVASAVAFDTVSYEVTNSSLIYKQWPMTCRGSNRYLFVCMTTNATWDADSVKFHGKKLGRVRADGYTDMWGVVNPDLIADTVHVWFHAAHYSSCVSVNYKNVNQSTPLRTATDNTGSATPSTITVSSTATDVVVADFAVNSGASQAPTAGGQIERIEKIITDGEAVSWNEIPGATTSVTMGTTLSPTMSWHVCGVALKHL
jgi:parallel beta-helix repeat protein